LLMLFTVLAYFAGSPERINLYHMLVMWSPGLAALLTAALTQTPLSRFGWGVSFKWLAAGWLLPPAYAGTAYLLIWFSGLGGVPEQSFVRELHQIPGLTGFEGNSVILPAFLYITIIYLVPSLFMSLGEELGWRGFLLPELTERFGLVKAGLISSAVWLVWHVPFILSGDYGEGATPLFYRLACFSLLILSTGMIMAWLRMRSGSIWPVVMMHAMHNGLIQMFLDPITIKKEHTAYFTGEFGLVPALVLLLLALFIFRSRDRYLSSLSS